MKLQIAPLASRTAHGLCPDEPLCGGNALPRSIISTTFSNGSDGQATWAFAEPLKHGSWMKFPAMHRHASGRVDERDEVQHEPWTEALTVNPDRRRPSMP